MNSLLPDFTSPAANATRDIFVNVLQQDTTPWRLASEEKEHKNQKLQLELYLGDLLSEIFNRPLIAIISNKISRFKPNRDWFFLMDNSQYELALDLKPLLQVNSQVAYFMQLIRLASDIRTNFDPAQLKIIEGFSTASPLYEQQLLLMEKGPQTEVIGLISFATPCLLQLIENYDVPSDISTQLMPSRKLDIVLRCLKPVVLQENEHYVLPLNDTCPVLRDTLSGKQYRFTFGASTGEDSIYLKLEDFSMAKDSESFPCSLSLGEIGININDLLELRPGSTISFKKPGIWQGTLQTGNSTWARVSITLEQEELRLTIDEIATLETLKMSCKSL